MGGVLILIDGCTSITGTIVNRSLVARAAVGCCAASDHLRLASVSDVQLALQIVDVSKFILCGAVSE